MLRNLTPWTRSLPVTRFDEEMSELIDRFFSSGDAWMRPNGQFMPTVNVAETDGAYEVSAELPGMKPEDFHVELKNGQLWLSGEKREEKEEKGKSFHRVERHCGEFRRAIPLPDAVTEEEVNAEYDGGVLKIVVPKRKDAQVKHIEVKTKAK